MNINPDFSPLNQFFDHIYVITLERATDRHQRIEQVLTGLQYDFFTGADNKDFKIEDLVQRGIYHEKKAIALHRYSKPMNRGQIGCSWSHRLVYEDMLKKGFQKVLILEDDVAPQKEGIELIGEMISELPADWELLYLDYHKNLSRNVTTWFKLLAYHIKNYFGCLKWSHKTINNLYTKPFSQHLRLAGYHDFTSAYAITAAAAKTLVELQTPLAFVADNLLAHACSNKLVHCFVTLPKVFEQDSQAQHKENRLSYVENSL